MLLISKKRISKLERKVLLCNSFIDKEIDVDFYRQERLKTEQVLDELKKKRKKILTISSIAGFGALFIGLFFLIYYILRQLI